MLFPIWFYCFIPKHSSSLNLFFSDFSLLVLHVRIAVSSNKSNRLLYCHILTCPSYFIAGNCWLLWHFLWQRLQQQGKQQQQQSSHLTETQLCSRFSVFLLPEVFTGNRRTSYPSADVSTYPAEPATWNSWCSMFYEQHTHAFWFHMCYRTWDSSCMLWMAQ